MSSGSESAALGVKVEFRLGVWSRKAEFGTIKVEFLLGVWSRKAEFRPGTCGSGSQS